jgi:hypothetical protein
MQTFKLALYSFDGSEFHHLWTNNSVMLKYSLPTDGPISAMTWCYGDFDGDGKYSIITCNVSRMWLYTFDDELYERTKKPQQGLIKTLDVWIDQLMACDFDDDGTDELIALEFPDNPDSCCVYHVGIYKISGDSLIEIWHGLDGIGGNSGITPPDRFISKYRIDGFPGEMPIIMGAQSDMSLSSYIGIGRTDSGQYEIVRPFPKPPQAHLRKGERGARQEKERIGKITIGPVGGVIFNDGDKILHYGSFLDYSNPDHRLTESSFAVLEDDHWRPLRKRDPSIRGLLCKFTSEPGRPGWLFIKDQKYFFYDKLPISE